MPCAAFGGSRAAALIWIMPFWHPLGMTFVAAASTVCRSNVRRPVLGHRRSSEAGEVRMPRQEQLALRDVVPHVAACGPHQRSSKILFVSQKRLFQQYLPTADSYLLQSPTRASAPPSEAQPTDRSWPAFKIGNAVRPWDRCCCAGG